MRGLSEKASGRADAATIPLIRPPPAATLSPGGETGRYYLLRAQFFEQAGLRVDAAQDFGDGGGGDRHRAVQGFVVTEGAAQRVDVAVEGRADHFTRRIDHRRTGVAADDVVGRGEVIDHALVDAA